MPIHSGSDFTREDTDELAVDCTHNPIFLTTEYTEYTEIVKVVALTDELACENFAMSRFFVGKRWRERRSRPPSATNVGDSLS